MLRVISGSLRGLKLQSLPGTDTRPTLDRVKEALFSMLFDRTADAVALDLFAGSGALGIELMSRGGAECTFVDFSGEALSVVRENLAKARLGDKTRVVQSDALSHLSKESRNYDVIFMDPPYMSELYLPALRTIIERGLLKPGGVVVCECLRGVDIDTSGFRAVKDKLYGKVRLLVLEEE